MARRWAGVTATSWPQVARAAFRPPVVNRDQALAVLERVSALTHLTGSAEQLSIHAERLPGGANDWEQNRGAMAYRSRPLRALTDFFARPRITNLTQGARLAASALLVTPWGSNRVRAGANLVCLATTYVLAPRHHWGGDGSDQVAWWSQAMTAATRLAGRDRRVEDAVLWATSIQAVMSYAVSGWVKVAGETWRNDEAFVGVMRTKVYGNQHVWRLIRRYPRLSAVIGKATLALECSYPLVFLARGRLTVPYLAASGSMHLAIAATMGLGRFVTAFGSMYGAVAYTLQPREQAPDRSDALARSTAAVATATLVALGAAAVRRRHRVLRWEPGDRATVTSTGATLAHREVRAEGAATSDTLFVLESGLMAPVHLWSRLVADLRRSGDVLTYGRPGYGPSSPGPDPRDLGSFVDDLESLLEQVGRGRRVVLVGHSLGGYIAHRLAVRRPDLVDLLVLLDATHPEELQRSPQQAQGNDGVLSGMRLGYLSMVAGAGPFMEPPQWAAAMEPRERDAALLLYRDARLWRAGIDEWRAAMAEFATEPGLTPHEGPTLVLTARGSVTTDEEMLQMHREMAAGGAGRHVVIEGAEHVTLLTSAPLVEQVAQEIRAAVRPERPALLARTEQVTLAAVAG